MSDASRFHQMCVELGNKITETMLDYPNDVAICALAGVLAAAMRTYVVPREAVISMLDLALRDLDRG